MLPQNAVKKYLETIQNVNTQETYKKVLEDYVLSVTSLKLINRYNLNMYKHKYKKSSTIATKLAAIRSFLDYCWEQGWIDNNPGWIVKNNINKKYSNCKNITMEDFKKIIKNSRTLAGIRDDLLLLTLYYVGDMRKVLNLMWWSDLPEPLLIVKTKYEKKLFKELGYEKAQEIKSGYLFFNLKKDSSKPLTNWYLKFLLRKRNKEMGFPETFIDVQTVKRLGAKEIYLRTGSIDQVMDYCGHKHKRTTYTFIQGLQ